MAVEGKHVSGAAPTDVATDGALGHVKAAGSGHQAICLIETQAKGLSGALIHRAERDPEEARRATGDRRRAKSSRTHSIAVEEP